MSSYKIHTSDTFMFKISTKIKKLRIDAKLNFDVKHLITQMKFSKYVLPSFQVM